MVKRRVDDDASMLGVTVNRGDHVGTEQMLDVLISDTGSLVDFGFLQEMHDSQHILKALERHGFGVWRGNRPASQASPVIWNPKRYRVKQKGTLHLLDAGKRNGKFNMAKSLNWVLVKDRIAKQRIVLADFHGIQTVGPNDRNRAAVAAVQKVAEWGPRHRCAVIVGGDWNAELDAGRATTPERRVLKPLGDWNWDRDGRTLRTRINRGIDGFATWDPDNILSVDWQVLGDRSWDGRVEDHLPVYSRWTIKHRRHKEK